MKIKWLGHSAFLITADDGTRLVTDPYGDYPGLSYRPIDEAADIVLVSHDHGDHVGARIKGDPKKVSGSGRTEAGGMEISGLETFHDTSKGRERGRNTVFCFTVDGIRICHLGDLGHELSGADLTRIGQVDVLMLPVGGIFTIDAGVASRICDQIKPSVAIPMHFRTDKCNFPMSGVDDFLEGKAGVSRAGASEVELKKEQFPQAIEIVVLEHAQ